MDDTQRYYRELTAFRDIVQQNDPGQKFEKILVLGCGNGQEAVMMQRLFDTATVGIDIHENFVPGLSAEIELVSYDGVDLPFPADSFDMVYSYHVLEHVEHPRNLISNVQRVLRPSGVFYLGVPNKDRIVGYFGMKNRTLWQKVTFNIRDWHKRLTNQWKNPMAHAGFSHTELEELLNSYFTSVSAVSKDYYLNKWPQLERFLHLLWQNGWHRRMSPSLYMLAQK
ncbi:MAG: class I SAM-dependent methyltransferase [candidate division KSB1 bacterium]|nr:class I SAM-dependent methyltransferase [candidate division KSB1 bacterium]